ncbi:slipin family protein [Solitalea koreensis]|uniref:SPFH domain, Band 7 family protein n=1 Tax=Solitalea koreensis TaxID=543615 RepID=A0A521CJU8_9SPHI|nr:slipin family protein [Solitalea koreensis]SMO59739.1 SPFH domain, Band 7 family protein [Solitalea koreensis]
MIQTFPVLFAILVLFGLIILANAIRILREYERGVVFRLGRLISGGIKGPGLIFLIPVIDKMVKVSLRTVVMDVPTQDIITEDNVSIKVNAVVYFRVLEAQKAIVEVENYLFATSQLSQTTLRSVLGQSHLDDLLSQRDKINQKLQQIIDARTEPWGIKVSNVEVKQIDLPQEMQRAMAKQAEAERERRSKVIAAEGEFQASQRLSDAAQILSEQPSALTLRYLQTLREIATENNSTTIFPIPIDFLKPFLGHDKISDQEKKGPNSSNTPTFTTDVVL